MMTSSVLLDLKKLQALARNAIKRAERAVKPMADKLADEIKDNAPEDTGALRDSIAVKTLTKGTTALAIVGPDLAYTMTYMGNVVKTPYEYAAKEDALTHFLAQNPPKADELAGFLMKEFND